MALRNLSTEERTFLDKQIQELNLLHLEMKSKDGKAFSYDWWQLAGKLNDTIDLYKWMIGAEERYKEVKEV